MASVRRKSELAIFLAGALALLVGLGISAAATPSDHPAGIRIRLDVNGHFGPLDSTIRDARCALEGKGANRSFRVSGDNGNSDRYRSFSLHITEWKGFGHVYQFINGSRQPGYFFLVGSRRFPTFSNSFSLPNPTPNESPAGTVILRHQGQVVSLHLVGHNTALTRGVSLLGSVNCTPFSD